MHVISRSRLAADACHTTHITSIASWASRSCVVYVHYVLEDNGSWPDDHLSATRRRTTRSPVGRSVAAIALPPAVRGLIIIIIIG